MIYKPKPYKMFFRVGTIFAIFLFIFFCGFCEKAFSKEGQPLKIGFIYIGPIGDAGWSYAHEQSRLWLIKTYPEIETIAVDRVSPKNAAQVMENMIYQGVHAIFATSLGYKQAVKNMATKYPDSHFFHCSDMYQSSNITTYSGRMYQVSYLAGSLAAYMSKTNTIGFLGSKIDPMIIHDLNAFALGAKRVKPNICIKAMWTGDWYAPQKSIDLTRCMVKQGVDVFLNRQDAAAAMQVAIDKNIYAIGFNTDLLKYTPKNIIASCVWNWTVFYDEIIPKLKQGLWKGVPLWWGMEKNAVKLSSFSKAVDKNTARRIRQLEAELMQGRLNVFGGPIYDQDGHLRIAKGKTASDSDLAKMDWIVYGVQSECSIPKTATDIKRVYIVQSYEQNNVCGAPQGRGIIDALKAEYGEKLLIKTHYMNTKTIHSNREKMRLDAELVIKKIADYKPHIVFTVDDNAFREVGLKLVNHPFPVVFTGMNALPKAYNKKTVFLDKNGIPSANITGVYEKLHTQTSFHVMKGILPDLKKVVMLLDNTPTGKAIAIQLKEELKNNVTGIDWEIRHVGSMAEYMRELKNINNDDEIGAVYNVVLSVKDKTGSSVDMKTTFKKFFQYSKKPSIAINFVFCRMGMFGGATVDFFDMGMLAGKMGIKLLNGQDIKKFPIQKAEKYLITFNLARAAMLGIAIPEDILAVAILYDKMILLEEEFEK